MCWLTHYLATTDQPPNARRYFLPPGYLPTTYYVRTDQTNEVPPYCLLSTYYLLSTYDLPIYYLLALATAY